jgi:hypothetical protein
MGIECTLYSKHALRMNDLFYKLKRFFALIKEQKLPHIKNNWEEFCVQRALPFWEWLQGTRVQVSGNGLLRELDVPIMNVTVFGQVES